MWHTPSWPHPAARPPQTAGAASPAAAWQASPLAAPTAQAAAPWRKGRRQQGRTGWLQGERQAAGGGGGERAAGAALPASFADLSGCARASGPGLAARIAVKKGASVGLGQRAQGNRSFRDSRKETEVSVIQRRIEVAGGPGKQRKCELGFPPLPHRRSHRPAAASACSNCTVRSSSAQPSRKQFTGSFGNSGRDIATRKRQKSRTLGGAARYRATGRAAGWWQQCEEARNRASRLQCWVR